MTLKEQINEIINTRQSITLTMLDVSVMKEGFRPECHILINNLTELINEGEVVELFTSCHGKSRHFYFPKGTEFKV